MSLSEITKEADRKRRFKYKLKSFDQIFGELERVENREAILIKYLSRIMKVVENPSWEGNEAKQVVVEILQVMFDEMQKQPDMSPGYLMIRDMGVDFYEALRKDILEDGDV